MKLKTGQQICGFKVLECDRIDERDTDTYRLIHEKSGARLLYLDNDDNDKAFTIAFKTPPTDSTGVFHILEHSVLCGSRKFPVLEPFGYLCKTSMATFINACTYSDKTIYPVSSTNEKDLMNLMDVYMDAVLFPNLYKNPNIFYQEGGHITLDKDNRPGFNGVVYNEMKGALSDADEYLIEKMDRDIYPDTCYGHTSGGWPSKIEELTYEQFCDTHRAHYRLDNSYIFLYGNLNFEKFAHFLDMEYLSCGEEIAAWQGLNESNNHLQPAKIEVQRAITTPHHIVKMHTDKKNQACGCSFATSTDTLQVAATDILLDALTSSNESPFKAKFLEKKVCGDVEFFLNSYNYQPVIYVECKQPCTDFGPKMMGFIQDSAREILDSGIDKELIEAAINRRLFMLEENIASMSPGIDAAVISLSTWLYDENNSIENLKYKDRLQRLLTLCDSDYFECLFKKTFIDNKHVTSAELVATDNDIEVDTPRNSGAISEQDAIKIRQKCDELERMHNTPDNPADLAKLPSLHLSDIEDAEPETHFRVVKLDNTQNYVHIDTKPSDIAYVNILYSINHLGFEDLEYLSILSDLLGNLNTKNFSAASLDTYIKKTIGTLSFSCSTTTDFFDKNKIIPFFIIRGASLKNNTSHLKNAINEIIYSTCFDDKNKIHNMLKQNLIQYRDKIVASGHVLAIHRAASYFDKKILASQHISGIDYFNFLSDLVENFDKRFDKFAAKMYELCERIFGAATHIFSNLGNDEVLAFMDFCSTNCEDQNSKEKQVFQVPNPKHKNEAFIIPSPVSYAGLAAKMPDADYTDSTKNKAAIDVASAPLSFDFLWSEIRLKGGAYGAGCRRLGSSNIMCYTYRDPNALQSFNTFKKIPEWLSNSKISEDELEKYIINTIATIDKPKTNRARMIEAESKYVRKIPKGFRESLRNATLNCTYTEIKRISKLLERPFNKSCVCLFGNKDDCLKSGLNVVDIFNS